MPKWIAIGVLALVLASATRFSWRVQPALSAQAPPVDANDEVGKLIEQLREPSNKVRYWGIKRPGGEMLTFSPPMHDLIRLGERARAKLQERINDGPIQMEVVLILGAIGDAATVPLLINAYPEGDVRKLDAGDVRWMKVISFTFALTYLTCQPIGRNRWGADANPQNKELWQAWWRQNAATFVVPLEKPNATWVPGYPVE